MTLHARLRSLGPVASALVLASCAAHPTPCSAPRWAPLPPPQPAAFSLAPGIVEQAAAYQDYMAKAAAVNPNFASGADVESALRFGGGYDPAAFQRGEIAYAAVAALQDPVFVATVRAYGADPAARASLASQIFANPRVVIGLQGSDTAAGLAISALMGQGKKLMATGEAVKQAAYDVQHQAWSSQVVPNREGRLASAKSAVGLGAPATPEEVSRLSAQAQGFSELGVNGPAASQPYPPVVIDALAVAALAALGEAGEDHADQLTAIMREPEGQTCLKRTRASLYECLAVSKPYYEDVFCLGEHVLQDTGQCVTIDAGAPPPVGTIIPASTFEKPPAKAAHKARAAHKKGRR